MDLINNKLSIIRHRHLNNYMATRLLIAIIMMVCIEARPIVVSDKCNENIRHGNTVTIVGMCFSPKVDTFGRKMCGQNAAPATFVMYKDPMYSSACNYILGGRSIRLLTVPGNLTCTIQPSDMVVRCFQTTSAIMQGYKLRLLDKHGADGRPFNVFGAYVKFRLESRENMPSVDCNDGSKRPTSKDMYPFSCTKYKPGSAQSNYGLIIKKQHA